MSAYLPLVSISGLVPITPETFAFYGEIARNKGFTHVASGPLVRSSYHASDFNPIESMGLR